MHNFSKPTVAPQTVLVNNGQSAQPPVADYTAPDTRSTDAENAPANEDTVPPEGSDEATVLSYYRSLIQRHSIAPPKHWREIRFELPSSVPELHLDPPLPEKEHFDTQAPASACLVLSLEGRRPEDTSVSAFMTQMVDYIYTLLNYCGAITAITSLRFVKKGSELSQMVFTVGNDTSLATAMLSHIRSGGMQAGYGPVVVDHPPNATFQIVDYHGKMNNGKGITKEQIQYLLAPFKDSGKGDIHVIEGYEPGVFYAPVKRPETVFSFLWNTFCSFLFQSDLYSRYGVLVTMALCPHVFLQKGVPYHEQQQQLGKWKEQQLRQRDDNAYDREHRAQNDSDAASDGDSVELEETGNDYYLSSMAKEIDIFADDAGDGFGGDLFSSGIAPRHHAPTHVEAPVLVEPSHPNVFDGTEGGFSTQLRPPVEPVAELPQLVEDESDPLVTAGLPNSGYPPPPMGGNYAPVFPTAVEPVPVTSWSLSGGPVGESVGILDGPYAPIDNSSNNYYLNNSSVIPNPNEYQPYAPMPPPRQEFNSAPIPLYYEDLEILVQDVEERVKHAFPMSLIPEKFDVNWPADSLSLMKSTPVSAKVPPRTVEISELFDVVTREQYKLSHLLQCTSPDEKVQHLRDRLAKLFCVCLPFDRMTEDWTVIHAPEDDGDDSTAQLPALLPYLLQAKSPLVRLLLVLYNNFTTVSLFSRYLLPFLGDLEVVEQYLVPCMRCAPTEHNPIVNRIVMHGDDFASWLNDSITSRASSDHGAILSNTGVASQRGNISQVGNVVDIFLSSLSWEQRSVCLAAYKTIPFVTSDMWEKEDPLRRTLLKLFLNADILDGTAVFGKLFPDGTPLTSEHLSFVIAATFPTQSSVSLSIQTSRLCGHFLRRIQLEKGELTEKDAAQLSEACRQTLKNAWCLKTLKQAYTSGGSTTDAPSDAVKGLEESVNGALRPVFTIPRPQHPVLFPVRLDKGSPVFPSEAETRPARPPKAVVGESTVYPFTHWKHDFTLLMKSYPAEGTPFPPLPVGWSSSTSRSYGYYYFKPPAKDGASTYKHPVNSQEYIVSPQEFLREGGTTTDPTEPNNMRVMDLANRKLAKTLFETSYFNDTFPKLKYITLDDFEAWFSDQRHRQYYLDVSVLELLGVWYRKEEQVGRDPYKTKDRITKELGNIHTKLGSLGGRLKTIHENYPERGEPFSALSRSWGVDLSKSTGVYVFTPPRRGAPTLYFHPHDKRSFRASPQEFARTFKLSVADIAAKSNKKFADVERWLADQRIRDDNIDKAVVSLLDISYVPFEELPKEETHKRSRSAHDHDDRDDNRRQDRHPNDHSSRRHRGRRR
ncbi:hypothetical protein, conserved [Angomonas deanei]|uniref:Uncharacterized protein n=1 Tax=Angomonas deanei TaxID=59799 RepID=A0A7G2CC79_9TRYP|nr:hypothetical protein, conserved [Angomonas deanei]